MPTTLRRSLVLGALALATTIPPLAAQERSVNVYSYREPQLLQPLLKAFTDGTGIKVNIIFAKDGLVERMSAEGRNSPADVLISNELGPLVQARLAEVTQPVAAADLLAAVTPLYRDADGHWLALTRRARVVFASRERVAQDAITYEDLADPKWKGRICMRSGQHTYNVALVAAMIAHLGEAKAEAWLRGLKANLARKPAGGDREQVRDVHAGLCDLAVGNTYYMGAMLDSRAPEQRQWAAAVKLIFPDAAGRGTHVNISGIALARHAPHAGPALELVRFMLSPTAQRLYAEANHEYPVVAAVPPSDVVKSWGDLKPDALPLARIAQLRKQASALVDKVGFDNGPGS